MIKEVIGDILETECKVIAHQVNCVGVMGSGVARCIKNKWPEIFTGYLDTIRSLDHECLGGCLILEAAPGKYVANLFGQYFYNGYYKNTEDYYKHPYYKRPGIDSSGKLRFTNYEALFTSLNTLKSEMEKYKVDSVSFPYKIGSDRGGGNWEIVKTMISEIFKDTNIIVEIRKKED